MEQLTSSAIKNIPDSLIQPQKLLELVVGILDKSHKGATTTLANFFFAIGSPYAIDCLQDAYRQAHHLREIDTIPEEAGARRPTCALDRIYAHDKVSPILRRYHLVQLVRRRDELQQKLNGRTRQQEPVMLKYGLRRQLPAKTLVGPKGAAGKALRDDERGLSKVSPRQRGGKRIVRPAIQGTQKPTLSWIQLEYLASKIWHRNIGSIARRKRGRHLELRVSSGPTSNDLS